MLFGETRLLDRAGLIDGFHYMPFWPAIIITVCLGKLSHPRADGRREGGWWVFFGTWLLLTEMHIFRLRDSWPLFLVALGVAIVWKEFVRTPRAHERVE